MLLFQLEKIYKDTIEKIVSNLIVEIDDRTINSILEFDNIPFEYRDDVVEVAIIKAFGNPKYHN